MLNLEELLEVYEKVMLERISFLEDITSTYEHSPHIGQHISLIRENKAHIEGLQVALNVAKAVFKSDTTCS